MCSGLWQPGPRFSCQLSRISFESWGLQDDSGSPRGDRTRLRYQMQRLFSATIQRPTVLFQRHGRHPRINGQIHC